MSDLWFLPGFVWSGVVFYLLYKEFWRTFKWLCVMFLFFGLGAVSYSISPGLQQVYWWGYGIVLFGMPARWIWLQLSGRQEDGN